MKLCWWLVLLALRLTRGDTDWSSCPTVCKCKWVSGKKVAECTGQSLSTVPDRLSPEIQSIDLSSNALHSLPSEAFRAVGLVNLERIDLLECDIEELHKDAFKGLECLDLLDLSHNRIHFLHPWTFRDIVGLRTLILSHNPITKLEDGLFTSMPNLLFIFLNDCHLSNIGNETFADLPSHTSVELNNNKLVHLNRAAFVPWNGYIHLSLQDNPWRCDCDLKDFRDWTIQKRVSVENVTCAEPQHLAGRLWTEINSTDFACKPQIIHHPPVKPTTIEASGEEVTLSCMVTGNPKPEVYWIGQSKIILNNSRSSDGGSSYSVREGGGWVNLTIGLSVQDRGELTFVAKGADGMVERNFTLVIPPGLP